MNVAYILTKIQQHVNRIEDKVDYKDWFVILSNKDLNQLQSDTSLPIQHEKEIDTIDTDSIEELKKALSDAGLKFKEERTKVYICKSPSI